MKLMGIEIDQAKLPTKQEVIDYLEEWGASDRHLAHFREQNYEAFGQDLIWNYPICDGIHFGFYIVPVQEGFLNLPYNALDEEECELFIMEDVAMIDNEELLCLIEAWISYSDGLLEFMRDIQRNLNEVNADD